MPENYYVKQTKLETTMTPEELIKAQARKEEKRAVRREEKRLKAEREEAEKLTRDAKRKADWRADYERRHNINPDEE